MPLITIALRQASCCQGSLAHLAKQGAGMPGRQGYVPGNDAACQRVSVTISLHGGGREISR